MKIGLAASFALLAAPLQAQRSEVPPKTLVVQRVDSLVRARLADPRGPASIAVAIVRRGDTLVDNAWGTADVTTNRPATPSTVYRIASVSKQFTAALVLKLVDRGRLALTDTLGRFLTGLRPEWRPITIEQLLNHTSGLHRDYNTEMRRRLPTQPVDTLIAWAARDTTLSAPGTRWAYSNTGYMLLGALIEKLYRKPYRDVLRDEIARPLGLASLGWCTSPRFRRQLTRGHERSAEGTLQLAPDVNTDIALGPGSICSTAGDLARWNAALHGGRVLSPASYTAMTTPHGPAAREYYGFGIRRRPTPYGPALEHDGGTIGGASENVWLPAESLSVTVFFNSTAGPATSPILSQLVRVALGDPLPGANGADSSAPTVAEGPRAFTGFYEGLRLGRGIEVRLENDTLVGVPTNGGRAPLLLQSGTTYFVGRVGSSTTITFVPGPDGRVTAMIYRSGPGQERTFPKTR